MQCIQRPARHRIHLSFHKRWRHLANCRRNDVDSNNSSTAISCTSLFCFASPRKSLYLQNLTDCVIRWVPSQTCSVTFDFHRCRFCRGLVVGSALGAGRGIRHDMLYLGYTRSKADWNQLNLPQGTENKKETEKITKKKLKQKQICWEETVRSRVRGVSPEGGIMSLWWEGFLKGYWTTRGYANSRIANSRTRQLADWSTRGCRWQ